MNPRTSLTDPLRIDELLLGPAQGVVGITFCPGKQGDAVAGSPWQRDLAIDLNAVAAWGARAVITLIEPHELALLKVRDLGEQVRASGLDWFHLPIVDLDCPAKPASAFNWALGPVPRPATPTADVRAGPVCDEPDDAGLPTPSAAPPDRVPNGSPVLLRPMAVLAGPATRSSPAFPRLSPARAIPTSAAVVPTALA